MRLSEHGIKIKNMNGFEYTSCDDSYQVYHNFVKVNDSQFAEDGFKTYKQARRWAEKYVRGLEAAKR
ncbi:hypothetical protein [Methylobacter sp.]|uniref:hypothetical protein n=1 Tax=Methylobacter sp. TaxID=2051955 RepID=UPI001205716A|nr:hypothetical protein [Methylobacter sp.]TAK59506.1 MAG: hypothetical protein EPO18_20305 [Methylobacter sp.]